MITAILLMGILDNLWNWINQVDTYLFLQLNTVYTNHFLDSVYPWYREGNTWMPLYLFIIIFAIQNFPKKAFSWILLIVITLILTDQISSSWVKPFFQRLRPCNDPNLIGQVRLLLDHCSGGYSFTSSHATNHFGFAVFLFITMGPFIGKWKYVLLLWAASISYGQVYVGVHYPLDIFCGAILGSSIGYIIGRFYLHKSGSLVA